MTHSTPSMQAAARFLAARKNCHPLAIEAEAAIERLPETVDNQYIVLSALIQHIDESAGMDYSLVRHHLEEALSALTEVRVHDEEDIVEFVRDRMQIDGEPA